MLNSLLHVLIVTHTLGMRRVGLWLRCNVLVWWGHSLTMVLELSSFEVLGAHCRVNELLFTEELTVILVSLLLSCFCGHRHTTHISNGISLPYHGMLLMFDGFCQLFVLDAQVFSRLDRLVVLWRCQCSYLKLLRGVHQAVRHNNVAVAAGHPQLLSVCHLSRMARLQQGRWNHINIRLAHLQVSVRCILVL